MKTRQGATLVEILLVMVILIMLGSLLTPVFIQAREEAIIARSAGNMRQLYVAMMLYADENPAPGPSGMHLPVSLGGLVRSFKLPDALLSTGGTPLPEMGRAVYTYMPPTEEGLITEAWAEHRARTQENAREPHLVS